MKNNQSLPIKRRKFLKGLSALPFIGGLSFASSARSFGTTKDLLSEDAISYQQTELKKLKSVLPKGKIGKLEMSRLVLGCNPMVGAAHARDLGYAGQLFKNYNTDAKIFETFSLAEQAGINMVNVIAEKPPMFPSNLTKLNEYRKSTGSKLQAMFQGGLDAEGDRLAPLKWAMENGVNAIYIAGTTSDGLVKNNEIDVLASAVEYVKSQGFPSGVGAHSIQVILACLKAGIRPDFYYKTMHHDRYWSAHPREFRAEFETMLRSEDHNKGHDNIWDIYPEQTVEVVRNLDVPLVGFKTLAGGAINPEEGILYAFQNGADFIDMGMFDYQIVENVNTVTEILESLKERERPWFA